MSDKKTIEILELLRELASGRQVVLRDWAAYSGLSERTLRRYVEDLRTVFGEDFVTSISRGAYVCKNREFFAAFSTPSELEAESEKLIDMLHIINPGFATLLPPAHKNTMKSSPKSSRIPFSSRVARTRPRPSLKSSQNFAKLSNLDAIQI